MVEVTIGLPLLIYVESIYIVGGETYKVTLMFLGLSLSRGYFCSFCQAGSATFKEYDNADPPSTRVPLGLQACDDAGPSSTRVPSGLQACDDADPPSMWVPSGLQREATPDRVRSWFIRVSRHDEIGPRTPSGVGPHSPDHL